MSSTTHAGFDTERSDPGILTVTFDQPERMNGMYAR